MLGCRAVAPNGVRQSQPSKFSKTKVGKLRKKNNFQLDSQKPLFGKTQTAFQNTSNDD
jgi:hypothetical protein